MLYDDNMLLLYYGNDFQHFQMNGLIGSLQEQLIVIVSMQLQFTKVDEDDSASNHIIMKVN